MDLLDTPSVGRVTGERAPPLPRDEPGLEQDRQVVTGERLSHPTGPGQETDGAATAAEMAEDQKAVRLPERRQLVGKTLHIAQSDGARHAL